MRGNTQLINYVCLYVSMKVYTVFLYDHLNIMSVCVLVTIIINLHNVLSEELFM